MSYGHSNPLTKEMIAERIERLEAVNGVLVAQLCHDTADMLRQILPTFGGTGSFQSICSEPRFACTDVFVIEIHLDRRAMGVDQRLQEWLRALRCFGDYLVECDRGERPLMTIGRVETATYGSDADVLFARMLQGAAKAMDLGSFQLVKPELPF